MLWNNSLDMLYTHFNFCLANSIWVLMPSMDSITDKSFHSLPKNSRLISPAIMCCARSLGSKESWVIFTTRLLGFREKPGSSPLLRTGPCGAPFLLAHLKVLKFPAIGAKMWRLSLNDSFPTAHSMFKPKTKATDPSYTASILSLPRLVLLWGRERKYSELSFVNVSKKTM